MRPSLGALCPQEMDGKQMEEKGGSIGGSWSILVMIKSIVLLG